MGWPNPLNSGRLTLVLTHWDENVPISIIIPGALTIVFFVTTNFIFILPMPGIFKGWKEGGVKRFEFPKSG